VIANASITGFDRIVHRVRGAGGVLGCAGGRHLRWWLIV